jgi:hypothetical protein
MLHCGNLGPLALSACSWHGGINVAQNASDVCYIGQTGNVGGRLKQHTAAKDYWERALVAVSLTNTWTDTHVGAHER